MTDPFIAALHAQQPGYQGGWGQLEFHGRVALEAESVNQKRRIVSLVWNKEDVIDVYASLFRDETPFDFMDTPRANSVASYASSVTVDGREVGVATARGYSLFFRKMLSHCVIDIEHADPGTEVIVHWGTPGGPTKPIRATVDRYPYKTDRRRADLKAL